MAHIDPRSPWIADAVARGATPQEDRWTSGAVPTLLAFQAHIVTPGVIRAFEKLRRDCPPHVHPVWLMHVPAGTPRPSGLGDIPLHFVTTPEIRTPDYPGKSGGADWSIWGGGHTDLPVMHLFRRFPDYGRYWLIEYDVRFSGRWRDFLAAFEANDADLLATSLRSVERDPTWWIWDTLVAPTGGGTVVPDFRPETRVAGFMPLFRASRRAMETMDRAYREGWTGHCEATWPTILRGAGLRIEDLGGNGEFVAPENRGRFYDNVPTAVDLSPGTFVFRPVKLPVPRMRRNRLWHPVKTIPDTARDTYWALLRRLRNGVTRINPLGRAR